MIYLIYYKSILFFLLKYFAYYLDLHLSFFINYHQVLKEYVCNFIILGNFLFFAFFEEIVAIRLLIIHGLILGLIISFKA